ncbi:MAG: heavy metal-associated domain-containing protein [Thermodesulfobacteriota bacterium]|nr:heavy metal-associated domain-containing protein [Thermodesulfobacteriota bacterium]
MTKITKSQCTAMGIVTVVIAAAFMAAVFAANPSLAEGPENDGNPSQLVKAVLAVDNMTCGGCVSTIKRGLHELNGVKEVRVDLSRDRVTVMYAPLLLPAPRRLSETVSALGYPATAVQEPEGEKSPPLSRKSGNQIRSACACGCGP